MEEARADSNARFQGNAPDRAGRLQPAGLSTTGTGPTGACRRRGGARTLSQLAWRVLGLRTARRRPALHPHPNHPRSITMKALFTPLAAWPLLCAAPHRPGHLQDRLHRPAVGPVCQRGELMLTHTQYAVEDINAKGGVLRAPSCSCCSLDSNSSAQESQSALQAAIDQGARAIVTGGSGLVGGHGTGAKRRRAKSSATRAGRSWCSTTSPSTRLTSLQLQHWSSSRPTRP